MLQQGPDQSDYLINQWLREVRPSLREEVMKRRSSGFGEKKIRDPLPINLPLGSPGNANNVVQIPIYSQGGIPPVVDEGSTDIHGGGGGYHTATITTGGTPATTAGTGGSTVGTASGSPHTPATSGFHTTVVTGASGTLHTLATFDTGGGEDRGCFECNFGVIDNRLPCLNAERYCMLFNGSAGLCGLGGAFCPFAYQDECWYSSDCWGAQPDGGCCVGSDNSQCPPFGVICCYDDGSQIGNAGICCGCAE